MKNKIVKLFTCMILLVLITSFSLAPLSMRGISTSAEDISYSVSTSSTQDTFWPGNSSEWTEVAPEDQGLNSSKIDEMFEFIENRSIDIHSVIIVRNGYLLTEEYLQFSQIYTNIDGSKTYPWGLLHDQASTTKSLMSIVIGIALQEGFLDNVSQTLYEFFADIWEPTFVDSELKKDITIEQLLTMNSGLIGEGPGYPPNAKTLLDSYGSIKWALDLVPLGFTPGQAGAFEYSNDGPNLLSGIITNVTGMSTEEFAKLYLFEPLGISEDEYSWWHDDYDISAGGYGFFCTPKVQAKLGLLCLNNGTWNGEQIVDIDYMKDATTHQITGWSDYGYLFYINISVMVTDWFGLPTIIEYDGYYTVGAGGQSIYVLPKYNLVVCFTASDGGPYEQMIINYILQFVPETGPNNPGIPGFDFNMIILMIFCGTTVLIIRRKKKSKNP
jgi:CubicO group peptidase (beta-lactamase class C family)